MTITLRKLKEQLEKIKAMGFVKTHRAHDTGIGKTLEDLLGIKENNLRLPDIGEVELKAKRIDSSSMLTLATKSPEPKGVNKVLFEKYKYLEKRENTIYIEMVAKLFRSEILDFRARRGRRAKCFEAVVQLRRKAFCEV